MQGKVSGLLRKLFVSLETVLVYKQVKVIIKMNVIRIYVENSSPSKSSSCQTSSKQAVESNICWRVRERKGRITESRQSDFVELQYYFLLLQAQDEAKGYYLIFKMTCVLSGNSSLHLQCKQLHMSTWPWQQHTVHRNEKILEFKNIS